MRDFANYLIATLSRIRIFLAAPPENKLTKEEYDNIDLYYYDDCPMTESYDDGCDLSFEDYSESEMNGIQNLNPFYIPF